METEKDPPVKPLREESLKRKEDTKISIMMYLVHFMCLALFSDVNILTSYRTQTHVSVNIYLVLAICFFMITVPDETTKVHQTS